MLASAVASQISSTTGQTPFYLRCAGYFSTISAVAAVAAIVYGIALSTIPLIVLGTTSLGSSILNYYFLRQIADLQAIEAESSRIQTLTDNLAQRDRQIHDLTNRLGILTRQVEEEMGKYTRLSEQNSADQQRATQQLQQAEKRFACLQESGKQKLTAFQKSMAEQERQSESDQKTIEALTEQIATLQSTLYGLQRQVQNTPDLTKQLKELEKARTQDASSSRDREAAVTQHIADYKAATEDAARLNEEALQMLASLQAYANDLQQTP